MSEAHDWAREVAHRELPALLDEALAEARRDVRAQLRDELVTALLAEAHRTPASAPAHPAPVPVPDTGARRGCYVYGVVAAGDGADVEVHAGVAGGLLDLVGHGPLVAVVGDIDLEGDVWRALQGSEPDLAVLEGEARRHERVLGSLVDRGGVVPFRFGTVVGTRDDVVALLAAGEGELLDDLRRLAGKREWGVQISWDGARARRSMAPAGDALGATSGTAYLEERRRDADARDGLEQLRADVARAVHERIDTVAADGVVLARDPRGGERRRAPGPEPVLRAAYLVPGDREDELHRVLDDELARGEAWALSGELTGPWPPYHFVRHRTALGVAG